MRSSGGEEGEVLVSLRDRLCDALIFGDVVHHLVEAITDEEHGIVIVWICRGREPLLLASEHGEDACVAIDTSGLRVLRVDCSKVIVHDFVSHGL